MRQYEPIWHQIKAKGKCIIRCAPAAQPRVVKAVIKEKDREPTAAGFSEKRLRIERENGTVTFTLVKKLTSLGSI